MTAVFSRGTFRPRTPLRAHLLRTAALLPLCGTFLSDAPAQLVVTSLPAGYTSSSLELGQPFAGALAFDPTNPNRLFASVGSYGNMSIIRANAATGTTTTVAAPFGSVGGIAILPNGDLAITENAAPFSGGSATTDTIVRARDLNSDGDFLDNGELTQLISPILHDGNFSGAQITVAPSGNPSAIPSGSLLLQTADGATSSELLVVRNPEGASPSFRPAAGAFYSGFQFNGGIGCASGGQVIVGESELDFLTFESRGRLVALSNTNGDEDIDAGEKQVIVDQANLPAGLSDLAVSADNRVFTVESSGNIRTVQLPANLLTGTATPTIFATTNSNYLSTVKLDRPGANYGGANPTAKLYVGGFMPDFSQATNLAIIQPAGLSAVEEWAIYE